MKLAAKAALLVVASVIIGSVWSPVVSAHGGHKPKRQECVKVEEVANHTWSGKAAILNVPGEKRLCESLFVVGAAFRYVDPTPNDGTSGKWPQALTGTSSVTEVVGPGTYIITTPAVCGQRDVYAQLGSAPNVPEYMEMYGDNEPKHLDKFSKGLVTYSSSDPATCASNGQTLTERQAKREARKAIKEYKKQVKKLEKKHHHWSGRRDER